jgi:hypothetical protein
LRSLQKRFPGLAVGEILELTNRDYRYRLIIPKASWTEIVGQLAQEQEWSNFKDEAAKYQGKSGRGYVRALHDVWAVMNRLQEDGDRQKRNREIEQHLLEDKIVKMEPILAGTGYWGRAEAEFGNAAMHVKDPKKRKQMVRRYEKLAVQLKDRSRKEREQILLEEIRKWKTTPENSGEDILRAANKTQEAAASLRKASSLIKFNTIDEIRQSGFDGFVPISSLQISKCREVPEQPGVYLVVRPNTARPDFLGESIGGHFKGKDPTVAVSELQRKWVEDALVLNIGKAGPGKATLRSRLNSYMRSGQGKRSGHSGGRYIWQLAHSDNLLVCWKVTPNDVPIKVEKVLIEKFETVYGKLPFANLNH